jgi:hypothetical protein
MAFGNNRKGKQPRAHFQLAGGSIIKFRHPYLAGQIESGASGVIDEIDISACCKLEGRFFEANPNQDSAKQTVLVDGSVVTICNKLLNGTITMPVVRTTGIVGTGDFIACCQLIKSVGDSVGGLLYKTDFVNGKALTKLYYGVTVQKVPDDVSEGNDVAVYNINLLYAGWIEAQSDSVADNKKHIWAVGNEKGLSAYFAPYSSQNSDGGGGTTDIPLSISNSGLVGSTLADNTTIDQEDNNDEIGVATSADSGYAGIIRDGNAI